MQLPRLLKIMGIPGLSGHHVQLASCQRKIFTQLKYLGSPTSLQQSDPTCSPQSCNHLSSIVQFLTIGGSRRYSELGNGRETSWPLPLSIFQQSAAWGMGVPLDAGVDTYGVCRGRVWRGPKATHIHMTFKAHKKEPMGAKWREKKEKRSSWPGQKITKNAMKITTLTHYQVSQNWAHCILIPTSQNQKVKPKKVRDSFK